RLDGIGVSVIRALADDVRFSSGPEGGTEVQIDFVARADGWRVPPGYGEASPDADWKIGHSGEVVVSLWPVALLSGVLGRVARTLAATAHFSLDRFSHVYLVTDTFPAHAAVATAGSRFGARLRAGDRR